MSRSAVDPWRAIRPPHLPRSDGRLPEIFLLPGDPARVDLAADVLDDHVVIGQNREYRIATASFSGCRIGLCSTGIGGPSTEIAIVELARLGVRSIIRIGGMASFVSEIESGSLCIVHSALAGGGASRFYNVEGFEISATREVTKDLEAAAILTGRSVHNIRILSTDSYYVGQGRPVPDLEQAAKRRFREIADSGAQGVDMESETVFAVGSALGLRVGAVLGVHANRATDTWFGDYGPLQRDVVLTAARAAATLTPG